MHVQLYLYSYADTARCPNDVPLKPNALVQPPTVGPTAVMTPSRRGPFLAGVLLALIASAAQQASTFILRTI